MMTTKEARIILGIFARYVSILLLGLGNLWIFYKFLTPITLKVLTFILSFYNTVTLEGIFIEMGHFTIAIVPACVAGAAFYLIFILVFSTHGLNPKKRLLVLLWSIITLFVLNILRMLVLIALIDNPSFETIHWILWNFASTLFVVGIWLAIIKIYKVRNIPIYSDFKYIWSLVEKTK